MTVAAEDRKTDLVERLAAEVRSRVPAEQRENAEQFVRRYFALVAPDDIIYTSFDTLIGACAGRVVPSDRRRAKWVTGDTLSCRATYT